MLQAAIRRACAGVGPGGSPGGNGRALISAAATAAGVQTGSFAPPRPRASDHPSPGTPSPTFGAVTTADAMAMGSSASSWCAPSGAEGAPALMPSSSDAASWCESTRFMCRARTGRTDAARRRKRRRTPSLPVARRWSSCHRWKFHQALAATTHTISESYQAQAWTHSRVAPRGDLACKLKTTRRRDGLAARGYPMPSTSLAACCCCCSAGLAALFWRNHQESEARRQRYSMLQADDDDDEDEPVRAITLKHSFVFLILNRRSHTRTHSLHARRSLRRSKSRKTRPRPRSQTTCSISRLTAERSRLVRVMASRRRPPAAPLR